MLKEDISTNVRPLRLVIEELLRPIIESMISKQLTRSHLCVCTWCSCEQHQFEFPGNTDTRIELTAYPPVVITDKIMLTCE